MNNYIYILSYIYYLISIDISSYFSEYKSSYIYICLPVTSKVFLFLCFKIHYVFRIH